MATLSAALLAVVALAVVGLGSEMAGAPGSGDGGHRTLLVGWNAGTDRDRPAAVSYGHKDAVNDMNAFFDNLPTSGCTTPDCIAQSRRSKPARHPRRPPLSPAQLRKYERTMLGYHRRAEAAITAKEMKGYASESTQIVTATDRGYEALEKHLKKREKARSDALRHRPEEPLVRDPRSSRSGSRSGRGRERDGRGWERRGHEWVDADTASKARIDKLGLPVEKDEHSRAFYAAQVCQGWVLVFGVCCGWEVSERVLGQRLVQRERASERERRTRACARARAHTHTHTHTQAHTHRHTHTGTRIAHMHVCANCVRAYTRAYARPHMSARSSPPTLTPTHTRSR
jgi:hypothetical protein